MRRPVIPARDRQRLIILLKGVERSQNLAVHLSCLHLGIDCHMANFGPAWEAASYNAYYYASYCAAPMAIAIGVTHRSRTTYWFWVLIAAVSTFAMSWLSISEMWTIRADVASTASEKATLKFVTEAGANNALMVAVLRTAIFIPVWALLGRWLWHLVHSGKLSWRAVRVGNRKE